MPAKVCKTMANELALYTSLRFDLLLLKVPSTRLKHAGWNFAHASPIYMLDYHRDRLLKAATYWNWTKAIQAIEGDEGLRRFQDFVSAVTAKPIEPHKVRVILSKDGRFTHDLAPRPEVSLGNLFPTSLPVPGAIETDANSGCLPLKTSAFEVVLDLEHTPRSEYTHYKTTRRAVYDEARQRAGIFGTDRKEVLLVNEDGASIMEGSHNTPYFWRGGRWVTPPVPEAVGESEGGGGQDGTSRRWALER